VAYFLGHLAGLYIEAKKAGRNDWISIFRRFQFLLHCDCNLVCGIYTTSLMEILEMSGTYDYSLYIRVRCSQRKS